MYRDKGFQKGEENARRAYSTSVFKPLPADHQTSQNIKGGSHPLRNQSNGLALDGRQGFGELKTWCDSSRGPRSVGEQNHSVSPAKKDLPGHRVQRDNYNLPDFVTNYENAKFFVIKSFQEVDIHKSIKYSVWASTQNGNKKLDAVYHDAYKLSREARKVCPIFLFFLANGSGQFVGLAEMTGPVDFDKNMDFWQLERWNGFFPVEWRIIKDIPNHHFQHILNEFNENKPVTYCRDTQEIGLKKGLQMLDIFKSYQVTTMLLDDYDFYEKQGKLLPSRSSKGQDPPVFHGYASSPSTKATSYSARTVAPSLQAKAIPNSRGLPTGRTNVASLLTKTTSFPQSRPAACIDAPSLQAKAVPNSRGLPTARTNVASLLTKTTSYPQSRPAACIDAPSLRAKAVPNSRGLPTARTNVASLLTKTTSYSQPLPIARSDAPNPSTRTLNSPSVSTHSETIHAKEECMLVASSDYKENSDTDKTNGVFEVGDLVMVYLKIRTFPSKKLHMKRIGPFRILRRIDDKDYKVHLPPDYRINNIFSAEDLSHETGDIVPPIKLPSRLLIAKDRISVVLCKDTVTSTRRTYTKFLVKWKYIQQDTWLNEDTFQQLDPEFYKRYMAYIDEEHVPEPAVTMSESVPATDSPKTNIAVPESVGNNVCDSSRTPESDPVTESSQMNIAVPESMGKNVSNSSTTLESDLVTESSKSAVT
ncbi:uncharacterized protein LOC113306589 [Papaver somniferum]|uniref:uncharacterized protein LOC113306589 n=1 Tax=Papaver somniferum TaxID=3469 RepID=UPI000E7028BF|nr:uncharacterized protein LOC113306589 [Papaver somniferum]XP_026411306.1 uncharacterized protein LOC113306589 [Papaver somniferum]